MRALFCLFVCLLALMQRTVNKFYLTTYLITSFSAWNNNLKDLISRETEMLVLYPSIFYHSKYKQSWTNGSAAALTHTNCFVPGNKMIQRCLWWAFHHLPAHTTICKSTAFPVLCSFSQVLRLSCESFWHLRWIGRPSVGVMSWSFFSFSCDPHVVPRIRD